MRHGKNCRAAFGGLGPCPQRHQLAAAAAATVVIVVAAAAIVVAVKAEPVAAAAAQQDKDDDEPSAVTVTHGRVPPFELHSILWWAAESVTAAAFDFPPFLKKLIS